jgi:glycosyltransferase involved in cell wall biosynthesis
MHVQGVHTLVAPMAMAAATLRRIPYVVTFHSGGHSQGWRNRIRSVQWRVVAPLLRRAAALVAVSEFEQRQFARVLNLPTARIKVIPNGSLTSSAPARPARDGPFHVVTVGRLEEYKGHQHVIAAWPAIAQRWPGSKLSVIGRGPYEQELRGLATEVGAGSIEFRHFPLDQRQGYLDELRTADVLVLLSEYESQGIVVLEALSSGASVVVHDATALAEYVQRGWAVGVGNVGSADEIVAAMGKALGDRRSAISLPTWDGCASALIETYRSVPRAM